MKKLEDSAILVVDDDAGMRDLMNLLLKSFGYKNIKTAEDGLDALEILMHHDTDLVICDLDMPGMNGVALLSIMQLGGPLSAIPFITMTGGQESRARATLNQGAVDYFLKSLDISFEELESKISRVLRARL